MGVRDGSVLTQTTVSLGIISDAPAMDMRLKKMERKLAISRGGTSKRRRKRQNREKAAKEEAEVEMRKQAKEYLDNEGNNWAARLHDGVRGDRFIVTKKSDAASGLPVGLATANDLRREHETRMREEQAARASAAKQRVEAAWAETEAKKAAEQAAAARKRAIKKKRKAERATQQKALSFSLEDEDEDG